MVIRRTENGVRQDIYPPIPKAAEMFLCENVDITEINEIEVPVALCGFEAGELYGFSFRNGEHFPVSQMLSTTVVTCYGLAEHNLQTGDIVTIQNSALYSGVWNVVRAGTSDFDIDATPIGADAGGGDVSKGSALTVLNGGAGTYAVAWQMSSFCSNTQTITFQAWVNTTAENKTRVRRKFPINDLGSTSSSGALILSVGDRIWLTAQSDSTHDLTNCCGNFIICKVVGT